MSLGCSLGVPDMADDRWSEVERVKKRTKELRIEIREDREDRKRRPRKRRKAQQLTPEERIYREARRRAERKIKFFQHLVSYVFVIGFLLLLSRPLAALVALGWGIGLASHFFSALMAPELRRSWIQTEVERQVQRSVTRERRTLEGERVRSLEELSASIAHEIRNPITAAKSLVQQMGEDPNSSENLEYAAVALEELERVERSVSHLLRFARDEDVSIQTMRMDEVVASAVGSLEERAKELGVELISVLDREGAMSGDPEKLRRVVLNLVRNAIDALAESSTAQPSVEVSMGENLAGSEVWLRVRDNGPGIPADERPRVFTPFHTSKRDGTGLGLAITKRIVEAHHGSIEVGEAASGGAEFIVSLPKDPG